VNISLIQATKATKIVKKMMIF